MPNDIPGFDAIAPLLAQLQPQQAPPTQQDQTIPTPQPQAPQAPSWLTPALDNFKEATENAKNAQESMRKYQQQMTDYLQPSQRDLDIQRMIAYTPEQRAKDLYNDYFGIGKDGKLDKVKYFTKMADELGRAFTGGKSYERPEERFRTQAQKEYQEEVSPLTRELYYDTLNKRTLASNASRDMANMNTTAAKNLSTASGMIGQLSRAQTAQTQAELAQARERNLKSMDDYRTKVLTPEKEAQTAQLVKENQNLAQFGMKTKPQLEVAVNNYRKYVKETEGRDLNETEALKAYQESFALRQNPARFSSIVSGPNGQFFDVNRGTGQGKPVSFGGQSGGGAPGEAAKSYYQNMGTPFITGYKPKGIENLAPEDQEVLSNYPVRHQLQGNDLTRARGAQLGYQNAQDMVQLIDKIPDKEFGTFGGLLSKAMANHFSSADPRLTAYLSTGTILGANHSAAQGFRSTQFAETIGKDLSTLTNKDALKAKVRQFEKTFTDQLANYPELKTLPFAKQMSALEQLRIWHPEIYDKYLQGAQK